MNRGLAGFYYCRVVGNLVKFSDGSLKSLHIRL
jgi:hypothetical protein